MAGTGAHPVRGNAELPPDRGGDRRAAGRARGGRRERGEPDPDCGALPSGDWRQREIGRLRGRTAPQEAAVGIGGCASAAAGGLRRECKKTNSAADERRLTRINLLV